ncbi:hypothetical protein DDD64_06215 [Actinotignum sanguinis]|uniref:LPXTG cell wall anchor domain-containing protein n=1 Tax=Actinotignum sanguinis TaxID=1445614 RepID=UPI000F7D5D96|nr:LPXTG cell wall anchor domain-containing protein [Actinotignum sanguinis]MDY5148683.1 LPXTG cell wall anchor domain-containing protein [Actinotignum sanguinis]RTE48899.1 hypothetical protein DDD64_06215 [Actinotignum sanguinis]
MKKILQRIATTLVVAGGVCGFGIGAAHAVGIEVETEQGSGYIEKSSKFSISSQCVAGEPQISVRETYVKYRHSLSLKVRLTGERRPPHFAMPFLKVRVNDSYNCTWVPASLTPRDNEGNPKVSLGSIHRFDCAGDTDITRAPKPDDTPVTVDILGRETRWGSWKHIAQFTPRITSRIPDYRVTLADATLLEHSDTSGRLDVDIPAPEAKAGQTVKVLAEGPDGSDVVAKFTLEQKDLCPTQAAVFPNPPKETPDIPEVEEEDEPEDPEPSPTPSVTETPSPSPTPSAPPSATPEPSEIPTSEPSETSTPTPTPTVTPTPHASGTPARNLPATGATHGSQSAFLAALLVVLGTGGILGARRRWC